MRTKVLMYLEELARSLSDELRTLLEREAMDDDREAAAAAKLLELKISDIRRCVAYLATRGHLKD